MKKFAPRVAIVALILSFFAVLFVTPANATSPDISVGSLSYFGRVGQSIDSEMNPTFNITGFSGAPTFTVTPALPSGLSLNSSTGEITGTPTVGIDTTAFTVTATFNTEVDSATFDLAIGEMINITSTVNSVAPSVANSSEIVLTFGHTSIVNNANGVISVVLQNATPTTPASCAGVTLSPAAGSCALNQSGSMYVYEFTGVDFSNPSATFTMTFASGTLTAGSNGMFGLNVNLSNSSNESPLNFGAPGINIGSGSSQQNQSVQFTTGSVSFQRSSSASFSTLAVGANVPAFTMTFGDYSNSSSVDQVNYFLGDPNANVFFTVPGALSNNNNSYVTWDPTATTCGISAIRLGGVAQTSSSGITCQKMAYVNGSVTQNWISFKFSTPTTVQISIDTAPGTFVVTQSGNLSFFATLFNNSVSPRLMSNNIQAFDASVQSTPSPTPTPTASPSTSASPTPTPSASSSASPSATPSITPSSAPQTLTETPVNFTIPVTPGQRIVGADVAIAATDLALSTEFSVVLRSTPQILASGRTVSSSFNTSVTIPDNLEAGWHSITFNATRSDGAAVAEVVYFKITADGTLLATSSDTPAELAFTGFITAGVLPLSLTVLLLGFVVFFLARELNPEFMRVMTLTRTAEGELVFVKRRIRTVDF